jgi:hypothetical protein
MIFAMHVGARCIPRLLGARLVTGEGHVACLDLATSAMIVTPGSRCGIARPAPVALFMPVCAPGRAIEVVVIISTV